MDKSWKLKDVLLIAVSAALFCGLQTPLLADGLARAGVLKGYAVSGDVDAELDIE